MKWTLTTFGFGMLSSWNWVFKHRLTLGMALFSAISWSWIWFIDVAKLSSSAITGWLTIMVVFGLIVGLSTLLFGLVIRFLARLPRTLPGWLWLINIAAVWALAEFLVAWAVTIIWMGRGGSWDSVSPFSSFSLLIVHTPLKFLSRWFGFYGLSGVVVAGLCSLVISRLRVYAAIVWGILIGLTLLSWGLYKTPTGAPVKTTIIANTLADQPPINVGASQLIVVPEYGLDGLNTSKVHQHFVNATQSNAYFVGTQQQPGPTGTSNIVIYGSLDRGFIRQTAKNRLIPGGEYLPFTLMVALKMFDKPTYDDFQVRRAVVKGKTALKPFTIDQNIVLGSGACSSIIATEDYRHEVRSGATLLTNSASLDIFAGSKIFAWQQASLGSFMAVANARSFIQSANDGPAYALNHDGRRLAQIYPVGTAQVSVNTNKSLTMYSRVGEWVPLLGVLCLAWDAWRARIMTRQAARKSSKARAKAAAK